MSAAFRAGVNGASLFIVLLSGLCSCANRYKFINEPKTWSEARQHCRKTMFSDLATVGSDEDVDQLLEAAGSYSGNVWIGLFDHTLGWEWSMKDDGVYGTNNQYPIPWASGAINIKRHEWKICTSLSNGLVSPVSCSHGRAFVCYDKSDAASQPTYVFKHWANLTWDEAQSYCREFHTDLVSIRTKQERTRIRQATGNRNVFTGLFRRTWSNWSDRTRHEFKNWLPGHPLIDTGDCAASLMGDENAGMWKEDDCNHKLPFMCQHEKKRLRIKLRVLKSAVDLNDPAVTEAILKLLEKKMKEKGITAELKLRWVKNPDNSVFQEEKEEKKDEL